jgi:hypothetical protein
MTIWYGVCVGSEHKYVQFARPALDRMNALARTIESRNNSSIFQAYNAILDQVSWREDAEALVLLHEDTELCDPRFEDKVRALLCDSTIGLIGCIGARQVQSLEWWRYEPFGKAEETRGVIHHTGGTHDVDMVDGLLMIVARPALRLRFDAATYHGFHGYDADFAFTVRAAGLRVVVTGIELVHHTKTGYGDRGAFDAANAAFVRKWPTPLHFRAVWKARHTMQDLRARAAEAIRRR